MARGSHKVWARQAGAWSGTPTFRITDENGNTVRIIREARNAQEALALYWRGVGASLAGTMMAKDIDQRISRARKTPASQSDPAAQPPQLLFEAAPSAQPATRKAGRPGRMLQPTPQHELFVDPGAVETRQDPEPSAQASAPEPQSAEVREPAAKDEQQIRRTPETAILDPQTIMLTRVNPNHLRPTDRPDNYLYHVTSGADAAAALQHGIIVSASDPIILTERQGVAYWLSILADDYDFIMDGPADFVVLRMRRHAVLDLLETDPMGSRNAGCPCFLLTGGNAEPRISG